MNHRYREFELSPELTRLFQVFVLLGGMVFVLGLFQAPQRTWASLLLVSLFAMGTGVAALLFIAFGYVTGATWNVALRRVPEAMTVLIPTGAIGLFAVFFAQPSLYSWTQAAHAGAAASWFKHLWLNWPFFLARSLVYVLLWSAFAVAIVRNSRKQDQDHSVEHTRRNARLSAVFLAVFGITFFLAYSDWVMSLEPEWYSTIFGIYSFAGLFSGGIAALIVFAVALEKLGPLEDVLNADHLHDLGKMLFAFCTFWAYIWFSQYMLIWYTNFPEESFYYVERLRAEWMPLFILNFFLNWALPFLALLPRATKRTPGLLVKVAIVVLLGRWLDLYLMINPTFMGRRPAFGAWEFGLMLGAVGVCSLVFFRALRRAPVVPVGDPRLAESLQHHQ